MSKIRIFLDEDLKEGKVIRIPKDELLHIKVRRVKKEENILVVNGRGFEAIGILDIKNKTVRIEKVNDITHRELPIKINLFLSLIKNDKFELMVQKVTELGVYSITPVTTKRVVVKFGKDKLKRLIKISQEALKQSGRAILPIINEPVSLEKIDKVSFGLVLWEKSDRKLKEVIDKVKNLDSISILIGPEGGLEEEEVMMLKEKGFVDVSLGKVILRAETSAIYITSVLRYICDP